MSDQVGRGGGNDVSHGAESSSGACIRNDSRDQPKPWQHGYSIDELKAIEDRFSEHNSHSLSPFSEMNKPVIAEGLRSGSLQVHDWGMVDVAYPKNQMPIKAYLDVVIAHKQPGDRVINAFCYEDRRAFIAYLIDDCTQPTYMWIWQECGDSVDVAKRSGFSFIGSKITSFGEIRGLWFKEGYGDLDNLFGSRRQFPRLDEAEYFGLKQADLYVDKDLIDAAVNELLTLGIDFTIHYSKYQVRKSWSALSLRGYTADPAFITKPSEMSKKWQTEHANDVFELQDTPLRAQLPAVEALHARLSARATRVHRIRLMKLTPGGGELKRHTDLVDKDTGITDGHLARFHFPIITNEDVLFSSWNMRGWKTEINMRSGECWYLDTRKPHRAINGGGTDRVHLVVDVESNSDVRALLR